MKKNNYFLREWKIPGLQKLLRVMKLTAFLLLISVISVLASTTYSQTKVLNLKMRNSSVKEVLQNIEAQSEFYFMYSEKLVDVNRKVSVNFRNKKINDVLDLLFAETNVEHTVKDRFILLTTPEVYYNTSKKNIQQTKPITGSVTDSNGHPLPGVSVYGKGTTNGTVTDNDGHYSLSNIADKTILVFSFIGYKTQEVLVDGKTTFDIVLQVDAIGIEEIVTIGYGTTKRTDLIGSIVSIKGDDLIEHPISTLEQGMQGMVSGVQVTQSSGQPGAGMSVTIRGVGSIAGGTQPLYVIDGIPIFNLDIRDLNGLSVLNPSDIASMEILKDAVATSIYGSRAANGVILITTKTGKAGKIKVNYDGYVGVQDVRKKLPLMNGEEFMNYTKEYFTNSESDPGQLEQYIKEIDDYGNANTDWQDEILKPAFQQNHNLSISGGNEKNRYYMSTSYQGQDGIVESTDFKRYSFRLNMNTKVTKWLDISARSVVSKVVQNGYLRNMGTNGRNQGKSGIGSTLRAAPTSPIYDANGKYALVAPYDFSDVDIENPVALTEALDRRSMYNYQGGFDIKIKFFEGLTNTTRLGLDYTNRKSDTYFPKTLTQMGSQTAMLDKSARFNVVLEDFLTYKTTLADKFNLEVVAGTSIQKETTELVQLSGVGFPSDKLQNNAMQAASSQGIPYTNNIESTLASFFGRFHLDYLGRYLLSFNIRSDGASVFSNSNKWAVFPAVALGWRISEEDFFDISWLSNLKLRGSWGETGNQAIRPYQSLYVGKIVNTPQGFGTGVGSGLAPNLPNENLTWETTEQLNIGADFGFVNNRIRASFDYYVKNTRDLLANVQLPSSSGFTWITGNVGEVQNKGFEFSIGADIVRTQDWKFTADFNISSNKNVVLSTYQDKDIFIQTRGLSAVGSSSVVRVGEPLFSFYTIKYLGMDENGQPQYEDLNDDGTINGKDSQITGSPFPDFIGGLNLNLTYKRVSLSMLWQGVSGNKINNRVLASAVSPNPKYNKMKNIKDFYPVISNQIIVKSSDRFIEDGSYLRMKNIKLSYNVPVRNNLLSSLTLYVTGNNLITFTNYSGYDPEVNSFSNVNQYMGVDGAAYPSVRTYTFGVNVSF